MCAFAAGMNAARASRQTSEHEEDVFQRANFVRHPPGGRDRERVEQVGIMWRGGGLHSGSKLHGKGRALNTRQRSLLEATLPETATTDGSDEDAEGEGPMPLFGGGAHASGSRFIGAPGGAASEAAGKAGSRGVGGSGTGRQERAVARSRKAPGAVRSAHLTHGGEAGTGSGRVGRVRTGSGSGSRATIGGGAGEQSGEEEEEKRSVGSAPSAREHAHGDVWRSGQFSMIDDDMSPVPTGTGAVPASVRVGTAGQVPRGVPAGKRDGVAPAVGQAAAAQGFDRDALADIVEAARAEAALAGAERTRDVESKRMGKWTSSADFGPGSGLGSSIRASSKACSWCCCRRNRTAPEPGSSSGSRFKGSFRGSRRRKFDQLDAFIRHADPLALGSDVQVTETAAEKRVAFARGKRSKVSENDDDFEGLDARGQPGCMLHPEADGLLYWNLAMILLIAFYTFAVPIRLAFDSSVPENPFVSATHGWLAIDCIADTLFLIDLAMNFRTGLKKDGSLVWNWQRIAITYLRTWFVIDAVASIPTSYISLFNADNASTASLQVGNMLRVLRIFKLFRAFRLKRIFKRLQSDGKINASFLRFVRIIFFLFFLWHMLACAYWAIATYQGFCAWVDPLISTNGTSTDIIAAYQAYGVSGHVNPNGFQYCAADWVPWKRLLDEGLLTQYLQAFLWGVTIVTGVGRDIIPQANVETLMSIVSIVFGVIVYAMIVGSLSSVISNLDSASAMRQRKLDDINLFMRHQKVPEDLQTAITDYYEFMWKRHQKLAGGGSLLAELPLALRMRLKIALTHHDVRRIPLFNGASPDTLVAITQCLSSVIAVPNEFVLLQGEVGAEVLAVKEGKLHEVVRPDLDAAAEDRWRDGPRRIVDERSWRDLFVQRQNKHKERFVRELIVGDIFGDNSIINIPHDTSVLALTFCDLYVIEADDLKLIIQGNRTLTARLERIAVRRRIELAGVVGSHAAASKAHAAVRREITDALRDTRLEWVRRQFAPAVETAVGATDGGDARPSVDSGDVENTRNDDDTGSGGPDEASEHDNGLVRLAPGVFYNEHGGKGSGVYSGGGQSKTHIGLGAPKHSPADGGPHDDSDEFPAKAERPNADTVKQNRALASLAPLSATVHGVDPPLADERDPGKADTEEQTPAACANLGDEQEAGETHSGSVGPSRRLLPALVTAAHRNIGEGSDEKTAANEHAVSPAGSTASASTVDSVASLLGTNARGRLRAMIEEGAMDDTALLIAERDAALGDRLAMEMEVEDLVRRRHADAMAAAELDRQRHAAVLEVRQLREELDAARAEIARLQRHSVTDHGSVRGSTRHARGSQSGRAQGSFFGRILGGSFLGTRVGSGTRPRQGSEDLASVAEGSEDEEGESL